MYLFPIDTLAAFAVRKQPLKASSANTKISIPELKRFPHTVLYKLCPPLTYGWIGGSFSHAIRILFSKKPQELILQLFKQKSLLFAKLLVCTEFSLNVEIWEF